MPRRLLLFIAIEVAVLVGAFLYASRAIAHSYGFPLDDSWIYAVFARNLAEGKGMVYNAGQPVSPTGILYAILLGGLYKIAVAPIAAAMVSGALLHLGAAALIYKTARRIELEPPIAAIAAIAFAATPRLIWGALSGMEVPLYVFLVTLGIYWQVRWKWYEGYRAYLATLAFGLATLSRPECGAFLIASVLERVISSKHLDSGKGGLWRYARTVPVHALMFAVVVAPWIVFNLWATGLPMPAAFYAKAKLSVGLGLIETMRACWQSAAGYIAQAYTAVYRDNLVLVYVALTGGVLCWRWASKPSRAAVMILPLALLIVPAATGVLGHKGMGKTQLCFQTGRYSGYLPVLAALLAGVALAHVWPIVTRRLAARLALVALLTAAGWMCFLNSRTAAMAYGEDVRCINSMQVLLGRWAARLPEGTILAVNDAGAIPYFSHKTIIDTVGVTNPAIIPYLCRYRSRQPGLLEYLREHRPDYVILFPCWYSTLAARADLLQPVKVVRLQHNTICGGDTMVVYRPLWKGSTPTGVPGASLRSATRTPLARSQALRQRPI